MSPWRGARPAGLAWLEGRSGQTHLTCRPSCCRPRAGSSGTRSTPAWWAPRRRTPPGPRCGTCGRERRDQALTSRRAAPHPHPGAARGPVASAAPSGSPPRTFSPKALLGGLPVASPLCAPRPPPPPLWVLPRSAPQSPGGHLLNTAHPRHSAQRRESSEDLS